MPKEITKIEKCVFITGLYGWSVYYADSREEYINIDEAKHYNLIDELAVYKWLNEKK